jgi:prepilin-type N-terminal cleavage/methylation domain-containing protein
MVTELTRCEAAGRRAGFSLTELLIASAIALVVMAGVASLFGVFGGAVSQSQAIGELSARLRSTAWQLRQDLSGVTVDLVPWTRPEANAGYFELLEGSQRDATLAVSGTAATATSNLEGDTDDILLFTTRSLGGPFVGRFDADLIESDCAEVAWFCREAATQPVSGTSTKVYNLHRRQLLVMNYVGQSPFLSGGTATSVPVTSLVSGSTRRYDLSLRLEGAGAAPNSLADLTKRENRCFLAGTQSVRSLTFPFAVLTDASGRLATNATFDDTDRVWEDVMLTNVIGFDVRVFDPQPRTQLSSGIGLTPGDRGYSGAISGSTAAGAYVDLGWGGGSATAIAAAASWPPSGTTAFQTAGVQVRNATTANTLPVSTYDTWSLHYEFNGIDDDGDGVIDDGANGLDDNGNGVPDDPAEYETSPPYPVPLRGIEVRIRCYEPTSKQVRQITVRHSFMLK